MTATTTHKPNRVNAYADMGRRAGKAAYRKDHGLLSHCNRWLADALSAEEQSYRIEYRQAYNVAYRLASGFYDPPKYFR